MPTGRICCASRSSGPSANRRLSERLFPPFVPAPAGTQERHSLNERLGPHFRGDERREGTQPTQLAGRTDRIENKTASRLPGRRSGLTPLSLCLGGGGQIAELLQVGLLLLVARRQLEQARRGAAQDVVLRLLRQELQVVDGRGQVEIPVRVVRRVEELRFR